MNPQQFIILVNDLKVKANAGVRAWISLAALLDKVSTYYNNPLNIPLTQSQVDDIITIYLPLYQATLHNIEAAGDALGTDLF